VNTYLLVPSLFGLGLATGFVGTITGGSALLNVPALMSMGIAPQSAIASARIAAMGSMVAGLPAFHRQKLVDYRAAWPAALLGVLGAVIGAQLMFAVSDQVLKRAVGIITLLLLGLSLLRKPVQGQAGGYVVRSGDAMSGAAGRGELGPLRGAHSQPCSLSDEERLQDRPSGTADRVSNGVTTYAGGRTKRAVGYGLFLFAGLLGGFFGGQALLATYIFSLCFDKTLIESVGTRKASGLAIAIAAVLVYGFQGSIDWLSGLTLVVGTTIGAYYGSNYALRMGDRWITYLFNGVVLVACARMIFF
jgi:uncharacterized protein